MRFISHISRAFIAFTLFCAISATAVAQELDCKVKVVHNQIQGTNNSVFEALENALNDFMNNREWTDMQYQKAERINCTMNLTVKKYVPAENAFTCEMLYQLTRPVFNSSYNTTVFSMRDTEVAFTFSEQDNLDFNLNNLNNNLTTIMAYYAYLFIGLDMDTFAPLGGTEVLQMTQAIVNNAQALSAPGWKAFSDDRNRHAIINDYLESSMESMRQLLYKYHRQGLDEMARNPDRGRAAVTEALEMLKETHANKPRSMWPQTFTDYKHDEIVSIYTGHGTEKERTTVYDILSDINASQNSYWNKIKK